MDAMLRAACLAISPAKVTYLPGSYDKRFAGDIALLAFADGWESRELTENQVRLVWEKVVRYRRQIRAGDLIKHARQQFAPHGGPRHQSRRRPPGRS